MNLKKVYKLYREERLTVRNRGGRKRALGTRAPMAISQEPNQRWALDFVSDALACVQRFRLRSKESSTVAMAIAAATCRRSKLRRPKLADSFQVRSSRRNTS
jgi:hypothetical protein